MKRGVLAMLAAMTCSHAFAQTPDGSAQATDLAFVAFAKACAPNVGNPPRTEAEIKAEGFLPAPQSVADELSKDKAETVWLFPKPGIGVAVLVRPDALSCRVFLQRGDLTKLANAFTTVVQGIARPGIIVKKISEDDIGPAHNLTFRVHTEGQPSGSADRLFALTVNRSANPGVAAVITAAAVKPE